MKYIFAFLVMVFAGTALAQTPALPSSAWLKRCEDAGKRCEIVQRLMDQRSDRRVLEMAIGLTPGKETAQGVMILPLGVDMSQPFTLAIDAGAPLRFQVRYCLSDGCYGFMILPPAMLDSMKKGQMGTISFKTFDGQPGRLPLSMAGITEGLAALK